MFKSWQSPLADAFDSSVDSHPAFDSSLAIHLDVILSALLAGYTVIDGHSLSDQSVPNALATLSTPVWRYSCWTKLWTRFDCADCHNYNVDRRSFYWVGDGKLRDVIRCVNYWSNNNIIQYSLVYPVCLFFWWGFSSSATRFIALTYATVCRAETQHDHWSNRIFFLLPFASALYSCTASDSRDHLSMVHHHRSFRMNDDTTDQQQPDSDYFVCYSLLLPSLPRISQRIKEIPNRKRVRRMRERETEKESSRVKTSF